MPVNGVNHVNIIADDLDETCQFYESLLGLKRGETPGTGMGFRGAWLLDAADRPIIHLMAVHAERHAGLDRGSGAHLRGFRGHAPALRGAWAGAQHQRSPVRRSAADLRHRSEQREA
ncbi:MAG: VOC family protein [Sphingomonadales bacterium]|nr:VOC family protein [Sphingomonadales bacterium]